jgi:hypothetical protein
MAQKRVLSTPLEKLTDAFIGLLAGIHGIEAINRVLRTDPALQAAFGRAACAEQSTIQDTLDAGTHTNLGALAHNVLVWAREWRAPVVPAVRR